MGCLGTRKASEEEQALLLAERQLGFGRFPAERVETALKRWCASSLIPSRLEKALQSLPTPSPEHPGPLPKDQLTQLYRHFQSSLQDLVVFAVLLSSGPLSLKLQIWFDNIDAELKGYVTQQQFEGFLRVLVQVNSQLLPLLVLNSERVTGYVQSWRSLETDFVHNISAFLFTRSSHLTRADFSQELSEHYLKLTYCAGIRELLQEFHLHALATGSLH